MNAQELWFCHVRGYRAFRCRWQSRESSSARLDTSIGVFMVGSVTPGWDFVLYVWFKNKSCLRRHVCLRHQSTRLLGSTLVHLTLTISTQSARPVAPIICMFLRYTVQAFEPLVSRPSPSVAWVRYRSMGLRRYFEDGYTNGDLGRWVWPRFKRHFGLFCLIEWLWKQLCRFKEKLMSCPRSAPMYLSISVRPSMKIFRIMTDWRWVLPTNCLLTNLKDWETYASVLGEMSSMVRIGWHKTRWTWLQLDIVHDVKS